MRVDHLVGSDDTVCVIRDSAGGSEIQAGQCSATEFLLAGEDVFFTDGSTGAGIIGGPFGSASNLSIIKVQ